MNYKIIGQTNYPEIGKLYSDIQRISVSVTILKCVKKEEDEVGFIFIDGLKKYMEHSDNTYHFCYPTKGYFYEVERIN